MPGSLPRKSPLQATGGASASTWGTKSGAQRKSSTGHTNRVQQPKSVQHTLKILQWNAEGIPPPPKKKIALTYKLHAEKIDIGCLQETHLTSKNRGYQCFRMDRENRHKGGVVTLVKNSIAASEIKIDTGQEAEILDTKFTWDGEEHTLYNYYCPPDEDLSLFHINTTPGKCIVEGDFNGHSQSCVNNELNARGEELEGWQVTTNLQLLNNPEDTPTLYSRRWMTTSTPDLAFMSNDLVPNVTRNVQDQLAGSDHRPVLLSVDVNPSKTRNNTTPRWNYKKADWIKFSSLSNNYTSSINSKTKQIDKSARALKSNPKGSPRIYPKRSKKRPSTILD